MICLLLVIAAPAAGEDPVAVAPEIALVPGSFAPGHGPDGNSVFIEAPEGLILIDTGRHPAHRDKLIVFAHRTRRPVAAIFNTHWHLDHSTGNAEIRAEWPKAPLYTSNAIDGALTGFLAEGRKRNAALLTAGKESAERQAEIARGIAAIDNAQALRPNVPVTRTEAMTVAGRRLVVHQAPYAATEGDVWIEDPETKTVVAGDLVVAMVPFMDTACAEGWREALDAIAATDFRMLVPGHGDPMTKARFLSWRGAFNALLDCAASDAAKAKCVAGWVRDAAAFIPAGETRVPEMVGYYIDTRLRAVPEERQRYCRR